MGVGDFGGVQNFFHFFSFKINMVLSFPMSLTTISPYFWLILCIMIIKIHKTILSNKCKTFANLNSFLCGNFEPNFINLGRFWAILGYFFGPKISWAGPEPKKFGPRPIWAGVLWAAFGPGPILGQVGI